MLKNLKKNLKKILTFVPAHFATTHPSDPSYIPSQDALMNLDYQYGSNMMCQNNFVDYHPYQRTRELLNSSGFVEIPKTPQRMPVMGTRTYQHRRTLSNVSHCSNANRGFHVSLDDDAGAASELEYRFNSLTMEPYLVPFNNRLEAGEPQPAQIPNRMHLYENISAYQHLQNSNAQAPASEHNTPSHMLKTPRYANQNNILTISSDFGNPQASTNNKNSSTGCTPTHSTPQDSFTSDDSSYLSARDGVPSMSSQNRRFSPDNFLDTDEQSPFNPNAHHFHHQRRLSRRKEEETEKS